MVSRRKRARIVRGEQYGVFALVLLLIVVFADWGEIRRAFLDVTVIKEIFPEVVTTYLVNTVLYTVAAFAFGLALGLVLALMRLSSVPPYRWVANIYIEFFRGVPALLVIIAFGFGIPLAFGGATFPGGAHVAFSHWSKGGAEETDTTKQVGVWQYCSDVSGEALDSFMQEYPYTDSPEPNAI